MTEEAKYGNAATESTEIEQGKIHLKRWHCLNDSNNLERKHKKFSISGSYFHC